MNTYHVEYEVRVKTRAGGEFTVSPIRSDVSAEWTAEGHRKTGSTAEVVARVVASGPWMSPEEAERSVRGLRAAELAGLSLMLPPNPERAG